MSMSKKEKVEEVGEVISDFVIRIAKDPKATDAQLSTMASAFGSLPHMQDSIIMHRSL